MAELLIVAAVFEICRRITKYRLYGRKITAPVMSAVMSELLDKLEFDELKLTYHNVLFFVFVSYFKSNILVHINCIVCFLNGK